MQTTGIDVRKALLHYKLNPNNYDEKAILDYIRAHTEPEDEQPSNTEICVIAMAFKY